MEYKAVKVLRLQLYQLVNLKVYTPENIKNCLLQETRLDLIRDIKLDINYSTFLIDYQTEDEIGRRDASKRNWSI